MYGVRVGLWSVITFVACGCAAKNAPADGAAVLWFGGDVHFGQHGHKLFDRLTLDGPLVVNLEGPISQEAAPSMAERLTNPSNTGQLLRAENVMAAGVDNNHSRDEGEPGVARTQTELTKAGILSLGEVTLNIRGTHVTLLQIDLSSGIGDAMTARLKAAVAKEGPLVVLFHVASPALYLPEPTKRAAVEAAVAQGANAVLVHGSHSIGRVERRGSTVIAWGLGNVVFDCDCTKEDEGLLVRLQFSRDGIERATVLPIHAGLHGEAAIASRDAEADLSLLESLGSIFLKKTSRAADW